MTTETQNNEETKVILKGVDASLAKREMSKEDFRVIKEILYPNVAKDETLLMAIDYCKARKLDIMKRTIQIVPIWDSKQKCMVDTIWPSIAEMRITATRTGQYAGKSEAEFGEDVTETIGAAKITYPKWCKIVVYRMLNGVRCEFSTKILWKENFKSKKDGTPNAMWQQRPYAQLEKCAEAAALRSAFPEEIGNDYTGDEAFSANEVMVNVTPDRNEIENFITQSQAMELEELVKESGKSIESICQIYKIHSFLQLPADRFEDLKKKLEV